MHYIEAEMLWIIKAAKEIDWKQLVGIAKNIVIRKKKYIVGHWQALLNIVTILENVSLQ